MHAYVRHSLGFLTIYLCNTNFVAMSRMTSRDVGERGVLTVAS